MGVLLALLVPNPALACLPWVEGGVTVLADAPSGAVAADLDGDGDADVVVSSSDDHTVAWHENLGTGSFGPRQLVAVDALDAAGVAAGDFDGDGLADLAAVAFGAGGVLVWRNEGDGTFAAPQLLAAAAVVDPRIGTADLDGDGRLDLLATITAPGRFVWWRNLGGGLFGAEAVLADLGGGAMEAFAAEDLDDDADVDLVLSSGDDVWLVENLGAGSFAGPRLIHSPALWGLGAPAIADVDRDGRPDVVFTVQGLATAGWLPNLGGLGFGLARLAGLVVSPTGVVAVEGGLVVSTAEAMWFLENPGDGTFSAPVEVGALTDDGDPDAAGDRLTLGDLDGDGAPDVLAASVYDRVVWFRNPLAADADRDGLTDAAETCATGTDPALGDTDGGGAADYDEVAVGTNPLDAADDPVVADSDGDGLSDAFELGVSGSDPDAVDSDGDGLPDASEVAGGTDPTSTDTDGDGLADPVEQTLGTDPADADTDGDGRDDGAEGVTDPLDADTDGDGLDDGRDGDPLVPAPDGDGDGLIDALEAEFGGDPAVPDTDGDGLDDGAEVDAGTAVDAADTDADGVADGVEVWVTGSDPTVDETFCLPWAEMATPPGVGALALALGDLDGDSDLDGLIGGEDADVPLGWAENLGGGTFAAPVAIGGIGPDVGAVALADLDGDGDLDAVAGSNSLYQAENLGYGSFAGAQFLGGCGDMADLAVGNVDGDTDSDLVWAGVACDLNWFEALGGGYFAVWEAVTPFWEDTGSLAVALGDLDGDSTSDIVYAGQTAPTTVGWYGGVFNSVAAAPINAGFALPSDVGVLDVDADGDADVVAVFPFAGELGWYPNLGAGAFGPLQPVPAGEAPTGLLLADLDGDGWTDAVVTDDAGALAWHRNLGGGFGARRWIADVPVGTSVPVAGDLDRDGALDLAVARGDGAVAWFRNPLRADADHDGLYDLTEACVSGTDPALADTDGGGTSDGDELVAWTDPSRSGDDAPPADADGDGLSDALESSFWGTDPASIDTDGDGLDDFAEVAIDFDPRVADGDDDGLDDLGEVAAESDPAVADSDGDGLLDGAEVAASASPWTPDTDGDGIPDGADPAPTVPDPDSDGDGLADPAELAIGADPSAWDSDGDLRSDGDEVRDGTDPLAHDTDGDGAFDGVEVVLTGTDPRVPAFACLNWSQETQRAVSAVVVAAPDLDNDGDPDVLSGCWTGPGARLAENQLGEITNPRSLLDATDYSVGAIGVDLDGDGLREPVVAANGNLQWWPNDGAMVFGAMDLVDATGVSGIAAADVDGDGDEDVVGAREGAGALTVWENRLNGRLEPLRDLAGDLVGPVQLAVGDIDGDGAVDLAAVSPTTGTVAWWSNDGAGSFGAARVVATDLPGVAVLALGDLDGDSDLDLVVGTWENPTLRSWENRRALGFVSAPAVALFTGELGLHAIVIADLDGDGDGDVATATADGLGGPGAVHWYEQLGRFTFGLPVDLLYSVDGLVAADIDGDGAPDLAYASSYWDDLGTLRNNTRDDLDGDFITDTVEICVVGTDAGTADSDGGGTNDGEELWMLSDPLSASDDRPPPDADGDGYSDGYERFVATTNPNSEGLDVDDTPTILPTDPPLPPVDPGGPIARAEGCGCSSPGAWQPATALWLLAVITASRRTLSRGATARQRRRDRGSSAS